MKRILCLLLVLLLAPGSAAASTRTPATTVVDVLAGDVWSVCLLSDGTLCYAGDPSLPAAGEIPGWRDIARIELNGTDPGMPDILVGYRNDGGVVLASVSPQTDYAYGPDWSAADLSAWRGVEKLCLSEQLCVGLRGDGTVLAAAASDEYRALAKTVSGWRDLADLATDGYSVTVGLKKDGSVVCTDQTALSQQGGYWGGSWGAPSEWHDIERLLPVWNGIYALRADGAVLGMDDPSWHDVVQICSGLDSIFGLRADGTVAVTPHEADRDPRLANVATWKNIRSLAFSFYLPVGLRTDGTVCSVPGDVEWGGGAWDFTGWTDVSSVVCCDFFTIGLRTDGSVLVTNGECGPSEYWEAAESENYDAILREVSGWTGIEKIVLSEPYLGSVSEVFVIGLKSDGKLVAVGCNDSGQISFPPELMASGPSEADLQAVGDRISYPKESSYLSSYETMYVNVSSTHIYYNQDGLASHRRPYYALAGEEVLVLAREGALSCVIFTKNGVRHSGWIYTKYLSY